MTLEEKQYYHILGDTIVHSKSSVENSLISYADSFVSLPVSKLYEDRLNLEKYQGMLSDKHIYIIGSLPVITIEEIEKGYVLTTYYFRIGEETDLKSIVFPNCCAENSHFNIPRLISQRYSKYAMKVLYIGQAYGKNGSKNFIDRLRKHETLQKIVIDHQKDQVNEITLLGLGLQEGNYMITHISPAGQKSCNKNRINNGTDALFETTEKERIDVFEACLISYFKPCYNSKLKNNFPKMSHKMLDSFYERDIQAVGAEINIEFFPFQLYAPLISSNFNHRVAYNLHKEDERKSVFAI